MGGYEEVAKFLARHYKLNQPDVRAAIRRSQQRRVLDAWVQFCQSPPTSEAIRLSSRMQSKGFGIRHSKFNALVLDSHQIEALWNLARETGATYPESWDKSLPPASRAFAVQSRPSVIDRILVMNHRGTVQEVVWNRYAAGFCALIGLRPDNPRLVAADIEVAQRMQHDRATIGHREEVACVYTDLFRGDACPRWDIPLKLLTAAPRYCAPQKTPSYSAPEDLITIQQALDQFPGLEQNVDGMPFDWVMEARPKSSAFAFKDLRFALIADMIPGKVTQVPPACASVLEQTGTRQEDVTRLIRRFQERGRWQIAEDVERLSLTRIIARDQKMKVKETANDYRIVKGAETVSLANFSLRISSSVVFPNQNGDRYCQATLRCGTAEEEVLFSQNLLNEKVQSLENELQRQLSVAKKDRAGNPTVIEVSKFRTHVVPHLRTQAAKAAPTPSPASCWTLRGSGRPARSCAPLCPS